MSEQPATWTTIGPRTDAWVALGRDCYVRASEVVAVHDGDLVHGMDGRPWYKIAPFRPEDQGPVRGTVLLRSGDLLPAYVSAATVVKRLREVGA